MEGRIFLTRAIRGVARASGVSLMELSRKACLDGDRVESTLNGRRRATDVELELLCAALGGAPEQIVATFEKIVTSLAAMRDSK